MDLITIIAIVSVGTAAAFWIVTQWNIIRTKNVLLKFQTEAREHAANLITAQFSRMETLISALETRLNGAISLEMEQIDIPEVDLPALRAALTADLQGLLASQGDSLKTQVLESTQASMAAMKSGLTRGLHKELGALEGPIDEFAEGLLQQAAASMAPQDMLLAQIMQMDVSDKFARDNPLATLALRYGKMGLLKGVTEGIMPGVGQAPAATQVRTSPFG